MPQRTEARAATPEEARRFHQIEAAAAILRAIEHSPRCKASSDIRCSCGLTEAIEAVGRLWRWDNAGREDWPR